MAFWNDKKKSKNKDDKNVKSHENDTNNIQAKEQNIEKDIKDINKDVYYKDVLNTNEVSNNKDTNFDEIVVEKDYLKKLPDGYDVISDYQDNIEQSVVDNLFDYFGRTYYKVNSDDELSKLSDNGRDIKVRNKYTSKNDLELYKYTRNVFRISWIISLILLILASLGWGLYGGLAGTSISQIEQLSYDLSATSSFITCYKGWIIFFIFWLVFISFLSLLFIISFIFTIIYLRRVYYSKDRLRSKNKLWNKSFNNFANNLNKQAILNAIQASIPDFVLDKYTPRFEKSIYNIHNRIYNYANIPDDAHQIDFGCQASGFYKGCAFSLSFSKWEWFREAKVINQEQISQAKVHLNARRSLRRFEDTICVLAIDTYAEPKLNFVLNNPEGRNLRLQNEIFNKVFSLAVNNPTIAYTVFTPYVQHTLARCKTWSPISRAIRQVIKEGSKIYVVFDGREDFFNFDRITNPDLNYVFNTAKVLESFKLSSSLDIKEVPYGSLDKTASLMTEYILEEVDLLFSALEMGICYPYDDLLVAKKKHSKTLYDVLEEKKLTSGDKFKTITSLESNFDDINSRISDIDFNKEPLKFKPMVNIDISQNNPLYDSTIEDSLNRINN